jgi:hemerythrin superfamily protein
MSVRIENSNQADPIGWLKHDHQVIRTYLQELNGTTAADSTAHFEGLKRLLSLHNAIEENLVYPALAKLAGDREQAMELFHETAEADILVFTVTQARVRDDEAAFQSGVRDLTNAILEHVQVEETQAFPLLESAGPEVLRKLAHDIVEFRGALTSSAPTASI